MRCDLEGRLNDQVCCKAFPSCCKLQLWNCGSWLMLLMVFGIFKAVNTNIAIPWNVATFSMGDWYQRFGVTNWNVLSIRWTPCNIL
jgi:hypothetical protein